MASIHSSQHPRFRSGAFGLIPAILLAAALTGCGQDSGLRSLGAATQPTAGPGFEDVSNGGGGGSGETTSGTTNNGGAIITTPMSASAGGTIVCGRFTLTVPAGALDLDESITLMDLTDVKGYPCVQILPSEIRFRTKAVLDARVSDFFAPETGSVFWLHTNPHGKVAWSAVGGSSSNSSVSADLTRTGMFAVIAG